MSPTRTRPLSFALAFAAVLAFALAEGRSSAQDGGKPKPKDDALERLLEEIKDTKPKADDAPRAEPSKAGEKPAPGADAKSEDKSKGKDKGEKKPGGDVAPKDKALDSLLEKLGETPDRPSTDDRPKGPGGQDQPDDQPKPPGDKDKDQDKGKKPGADPLTGKAKDLDEHLEELTGKTRKKPRKGDGSGPLSEVIKEMRDVEQRLGKPDTGEETRKKQQQIVKNLETLIEQMRSSSQSRSRQRSLAMGKNQPGQNQQGQTPGSTGGYAPNAKPETPRNKRSLAGGKDEWGNLPAADRQELENVFKEEFLTTRAELIRRYYESLAKKAVKRGE